MGCAYAARRSVAVRRDTATTLGSDKSDTKNNICAAHSIDEFADMVCMCGNNAYETSALGYDKVDGQSELERQVKECGLPAEKSFFYAPKAFGGPYGTAQGGQWDTSFRRLANSACTSLVMGCEIQGTRVKVSRKNTIANKPGCGVPGKTPCCAVTYSGKTNPCFTQCGVTNQQCEGGRTPKRVEKY